MSQMPLNYSAKDLKELQALTKDLVPLNLRRFWTDLILTAIVAWFFLYISFLSPNGGFTQIFSLLVATLAFYRGANFVHDISHSHGELDTFKMAYNLLFGFFLRVPAYMGDSHNDHHSAAKFGTKLDPEYESWGHRHEWNVFRPLLASLISPFLLLFRMVFVTCAYLVRGIGLQQKVFVHLSSIVMNFSYARSSFTEEQLNEMMESDVFCLLYTLTCFSVWASSHFNIVGFLGYYSIFVVSNGLFSFRALGNHRYLSNFEKKGAGTQFFDSVSIVDDHSLISKLATPLWAPLHSNFHSIHHLLPHMPYHAMPEIHRRLLAHPTWSHIYGATTEKSLYSSLNKLYQRAKAHRVHEKNLAPLNSFTYEVSEKPN
ncbi:MAG: fatty acid desaturase [Pseudomonadota bacterium]